MNLKDFRDIYNTKDVECLKTVSKSRLCECLEFLMKEKPEYLKKFKANGTLQYLCPMLYDTISMKGFTRNFGKMVNILIEYQGKSVNKDLRWAVFMSPVLCNCVKINLKLKGVYLYLRKINISKKRACNIMKYLYFFNDASPWQKYHVKELILIFGINNLHFLFELKNKILSSMNSSEKEVRIYCNSQIKIKYDYIIDRNETYSILPCRTILNEMETAGYNPILLRKALVGFYEYVIVNHNHIEEVSIDNLKAMYSRVLLRITPMVREEGNSVFNYYCARRRNDIC